MRPFAHHRNEDQCPGCIDRLLDAHPDLVNWFWRMRGMQKDIEAMMHVSWAFRDEASQNEALASGASKLSWPNSKHNVMENGKPCSHALDIFQIKESGQAIFDPIFCAKINSISNSAGFKLRWGGEFKSLGDSGHFELI